MKKRLPDLSEKTRDVLRVAVQLARTRMWVPPSYRQIDRALGGIGLRAVGYHIGKLDEAGYVVRAGEKNERYYVILYDEDKEPTPFALLTGAVDDAGD